MQLLILRQGYGGGGRKGDGVRPTNPMDADTQRLNNVLLHKPLTDEAKRFLKDKGALAVMKLERKREERTITEEEAKILNQFQGWALTVDEVKLNTLDFPRECEQEVLYHVLEKKGLNVKRGFPWGKAKKYTRWACRVLNFFGLNIHPAPDSIEHFDVASDRMPNCWRKPNEADCDKKWHCNVNTAVLAKIEDDDHPRTGREMI